MTCIIESGVAGADLSTKQYCFVKADGADSEKIKAQDSDTNLETVGVLTNTPANGKRAEYVFVGFADVIAGAALEPGDYVMSDASGHAAKATTGKVILGQYKPKVEGSAAPDAAVGDRVRIYIHADKTRLLA